MAKESRENSEIVITSLGESLIQLGTEEKIESIMKKVAGNVDNASFKIKEELNKCMEKDSSELLGKPKSSP